MPEGVRREVEVAHKDSVGRAVGADGACHAKDLAVALGSMVFSNRIVRMNAIKDGAEVLKGNADIKIIPSAYRHIFHFA